MDKKLKIGLSAAAIVAFVVWLLFGFFGVQAAFIDNEVSEANPFADVTTTTLLEEQASTTIKIAESSTTGEVDGSNSSTYLPATTTTQTPSTQITSLFVVGELSRGVFVGSGDYNVAGDAIILSDGTDRILRFENFMSDNGPDLDVYLRSDNGNFVSLGELKGNIGEQNYEIPDGLDLEEFSEAVIWCVRFSAEFGVASLR